MDTFLEFTLPIAMMLILGIAYLATIKDCIKNDKLYTLIVVYLAPFILFLGATPTFRHAQEALWRRDLTETAQATLFYMNTAPIPSSLQEVKEGLPENYSSFSLTGKAKDTLALVVHKDNSFTVFSRKKYFNKHKMHAWQGKDSTWFIYTAYSNYIKPLYSVDHDIKSAFKEVSRKILQYGKSANRMPQKWEEVPLSWYKNETLLNIWGNKIIYSLDTTQHAFTLTSEGFDQKHKPFTYSYKLKYTDKDSSFAEPWDRYDQGHFVKPQYEIDTMGIAARIDSIYGVKPKYYHSW